jgi:biotin carboxylase
VRNWLVLVESNTTGTGRLFAAAGRALGLRPVLLTADPSRYQYVASDQVTHVVVDTADALALARVAADLTAVAPLGAVLSSSEYFVSAAARLAVHSGLSAPDPGAVDRCRDKARQRRALAVMPGSPGFVECLEVRQAAEAAVRLGGDVVVKPCQGSGSEGVRACSGPEEAASWAERLLARRTNERGAPVSPRILVEQRVAGPEYSVELLNGRPWGVTAKHLGGAPYFVETGHDFPAGLDRAQWDAVTGTAEEALKILGLGRGPAHVELRLTTGGPVVIEVNPRLAGGMIPRLIELATGHDLIAAVVEGAMGRAAGPVPQPKRHASIRFLTAGVEGRVRSIDGLASARTTPGVVDAVCTLSVGERRRAHHSFRDRVGHVIAVGDTREAAITAAEAGRSAVVVGMDESESIGFA